MLVKKDFLGEVEGTYLHWTAYTASPAERGRADLLNPSTGHSELYDRL